MSSASRSKSLLSFLLCVSSLFAQDSTAVKTAPKPGDKPGKPGGTPGRVILTKEMKEAIAEEVKRQLALTNQEAQQVDPASSGIARMLSDNRQHVFVAGASLNLIDGGGKECTISEGDALQLGGAPPIDATAADLIVLSSKGGTECHKGAIVSVPIGDLQEMENHMREIIDAAFSEKGERGGSPPALHPEKPEFTGIAPPPDRNSGPLAAALAKVGLGQTIDQVTAILGAPTSILDEGQNTVYVYNGAKITFKGRRVSAIQW